MIHFFLIYNNSELLLNIGLLLVGCAVSGGLSFLIWMGGKDVYYGTFISLFFSILMSCICACSCIVACIQLGDSECFGCVGCMMFLLSVFTWVIYLFGFTNAVFYKNGIITRDISVSQAIDYPNSMAFYFTDGEFALDYLTFFQVSKGSVVTYSTSNDRYMYYYIVPLVTSVENLKKTNYTVDAFVVFEIYVYQENIPQVFQLPFQKTAISYDIIKSSNNMNFLTGINLMFSRFPNLTYTHSKYVFLKPESIENLRNSSSKLVLVGQAFYYIITGFITTVWIFVFIYRIKLWMKENNPCDPESTFNRSFFASLDSNSSESFELLEQELTQETKTFEF